MMTDSELLAIEARAKAATGGEWELQTGCSWRRIGTTGNDGDVLRPSNHPRDGWPDLDASHATLDFIAHAGGDNGDVLRLVAEVRRLKRTYDQPGCYQADGEPAGPCKAMFTMDTCAGCVRLPEGDRAELEGRG